MLYAPRQIGRLVDIIGFLESPVRDDFIGKHLAFLVSQVQENRYRIEGRFQKGVLQLFQNRGDDESQKQMPPESFLRLHAQRNLRGTRTFLPTKNAAWTTSHTGFRRMQRKKERMERRNNRTFFLDKNGQEVTKTAAKTCQDAHSCALHVLRREDSVEIMA